MTPSEANAVFAADVVLIGNHPGSGSHILLIERRNPPFQGCRALPGGYVEPDEDSKTGAARELREEAGIDLAALGVELRFVGLYDNPYRDARKPRVVSAAYAAIVDGLPNAYAGDDAKTAEWLPVRKIYSSHFNLAFDHRRIIADALGWSDHE